MPLNKRFLLISQKSSYIASISFKQISTFPSDSEILKYPPSHSTNNQNLRLHVRFRFWGSLSSFYAVDKPNPPPHSYGDADVILFRNSMCRYRIKILNVEIIFHCDTYPLEKLLRVDATAAVAASILAAVSTLTRS